MTDLLASRSFSLDDQVASPDCRPTSIRCIWTRTSRGAPRSARRSCTAFTRSLWAANAVLQRFSDRDRQHLRPVSCNRSYLDELASVRLKRRTDRQIDVEVVAADTVVALIKLSSVPGKAAAGQPEFAPSAPRQLSVPINPSFEQLAGQTGAVAIVEADLAVAVSGARERHRAAGDQGLAGNVANRRHGMSRTALAVCRPRHQFQPGCGSSRRPRLRSRPRSTRAFGRCRSISPVTARPAGWTPLHARRRRPRPGCSEIMTARFRAAVRRIRDRWSSAVRAASARSRRGSSPPAADMPSSPTGTATRKPNEVAADIVSVGGHARSCVTMRCSRQPNSCKSIGAGRLLLLFRDAENLPAQVRPLRSRISCAAS